MNSNLSFMFYLQKGEMDKPQSYVKDFNLFKPYEKIHEKPYQCYFNIPLRNILSFYLKTVYPGLIIGASYPHGATEKITSGEISDFQLGISFDHTTGLPIITGSTVKGVLKSVFPEAGSKFKEEKLEYILDIVKNVIGNAKTNSTNNKNLEKEISNNWEKIFFGELPNRRQVFFDAYFIFNNENIFYDDYITSHEAGLTKEPIPIRFLKIKPDVQIRFQFILKDYNANGIQISSENILSIFKKILIDWGIGAKRNVGYGKLTDIK